MTEVAHLISTGCVNQVSLGSVGGQKGSFRLFLISKDSCKSLLDCSIAFSLHVAFLLSLFGKRLLCCVVNQMLFPMFDQ